MIFGDPQNFGGLDPTNKLKDGQTKLPDINS